MCCLYSVLDHDFSVLTPHHYAGKLSIYPLSQSLSIKNFLLLLLILGLNAWSIHFLFHKSQGFSNFLIVSQRKSISDHTQGCPPYRISCL